MEFISVTFKRNQEQPTDNNPVVYFLLAFIFVLTMYLLNEFGVKGWPIWISFIGAFSAILMMRFRNWGSKKKKAGQLDKELLITPKYIKIEGTTLPIENISKLRFEMDSYDDQTIFEIDAITKSDGTSNRISITIGGRTFSEFFRIGTAMHLAELEAVVKQLRVGGTDVEVIKKS